MSSLCSLWFNTVMSFLLENSLKNESNRLTWVTAFDQVSLLCFSMARRDYDSLKREVGLFLTFAILYLTTCFPLPGLCQHLSESDWSAFVLTPINKTLRKYHCISSSHSCTNGFHRSRILFTDQWHAGIRHKPSIPLLFQKKSFTIKDEVGRDVFSVRKKGTLSPKLILEDMNGT